MSFGQSTSAVEHYFKKHFLYPKLVYNISRQALHFIRDEEIRSRECGKNRKKCGCVMKITYGLPCACLIALKIDKKLPIRLDEINTHWKRLQIDEADDGQVDCSKEFRVIQERLRLSNQSMQLQIRDQLRQIAFSEITSLTAPVKQVDTKGAKKRAKSSKCNSSTTRSPSNWEHIDARYPDSQASQSKPAKPKRKTAHIGTLSPNAIPRRSIPFMEHMPLFMHSYIEDIIDVKGDGHCGFRVAAECLNKGEDSQGLVRSKLIRELTMFRKEYLPIFGTEARLQYILDGLFPPKVMPKNGIAPEENVGISFELRLTKFLHPFKMYACVEVKGSICCIPLSIVWCTLIKENPSDVFIASTKVTSEFVDESLIGSVSENDVVSNVGTSLAPKTDVVLSTITSVVPDIMLDQSVPDTC
ncbi:uncharacterized protein LOC123890567 [Trifolium pratense]|uniref:uncharacterized protein LOC123890567 n=1 Tax=Trifolium pratense TaxID=57577 RepID=UPI001E693474|nr:uncharacterized protein LOC123890567 [Trifolium pratense]